jgi:16S rRNA (cytidine1402-2'-O)-methyltransferase
MRSVTVAKLDCFVVEHPKTARNFKQRALCAGGDISISILDEHTHATELESLLEPLLTGRDVGLLSDAGCPAVADPGAALVRMAHKKNIRVVPLIGPSSVLLALMASGLNGQRFAFHGYRRAVPFAAKLVELERILSFATRQIFIERPIGIRSFAASCWPAATIRSVHFIRPDNGRRVHFNQDS